MLALALPGCGPGAVDPATLAPLQLTAEQAAAIQTQDDTVANEEGGQQKITRAVKATKLVRKIR